MNLENVLEILKVWSIGNRNTFLVAMLEGEKSIDEYIDVVFSHSNKHIEELNEKLENEKTKKDPSEGLIEHYNSWIEKAETVQKQLLLYRDKKKNK